MKKSKVERKNVPEFTAPPPNYIERVHTNYSVISEADFKAITELTRYFFRKSFSDYIYAVNFPNDSCLQKIDEYSFAFPLNMIKNSDEKISKKKLSQIISYIYSISFPPSLQVIAENSLGGCRYLNSVTFLKNDKGENFLESICKSAFADTKIEEIVIPENIKEIGSFVFPKFLKSIEFENGAPMLLTVNDYAFANTQIEKIAMPLNINPFIESKNIFFNCKQLKSIVFDQALNKQEEPENSIIDDEINDSAQSYLLSQTKIENLEVFVSDLSKFYFYNTPNLTSITIPKSNYSKFIKKKGLVYTKNQKKLIVAERNIKSATISSKCAIILNFALNVPSLEKVAFEDNSELQEISCFAFSESQIKKLTLPETVTKISPGCFYKCSKLEKINIPKSIEIIDYVTFSFTNLSSITIPKSVTKIGYGSFYKCQKLCKVLFEEGSNLNEIEALAFSETSLSSILIPKSVNKIGDFCFTNCTLLKSITFEENSVLQYIGEKCFNGTQITDFQLPSSIEHCDFSDTKANKISFPSSCSLLKISNFNSTQITEFVIPSSVEKIGKSAFLRCQNLAVVKVADISNSKLTEIEEKAFLGCNSLKEFELPKTVCYFGSQSFEDCEQFNCKISLETSNLRVCEFAFHNSGVTSFETSSDYISINRFAFKDCKQLKKLILKGLQKVYIRYSSFMDCTSLSTVKITQDLKFALFGDNCFSNTSIKEFDIPNRLVKIPNGCFKNCKKLIRVSFNESIIKSFGKEAFYETGLKSIVFPTKITNIGESCFENCKSLKEVTFPEHQYNTIVLGEKSFASSGIEKLHFQDCHLKFQYKCFYNCPDLTSVILNNSRVLILKSAFENSNIESFEFSNDKSSKCYNIYIPERAFKNCKKLQRLCFSNKCTYCENFCFEGCDNIKEIQFDRLKLVERFCRSWNICDKIIYRFDQQMNNEIIKIFLTNNDPNFVINEKYYFGFPSCRYNELSNIKESISNREIEYRNGGYYYENGKKLFRCNLSTQEFSVSKDTEIIESCAFKFSNLKKIDFEKGSILNTIESNVFEYLQIEEISIPDSVTLISDSAFRDCHNLKAVILNETSQLITIGDSAFEKTAINTILFPPNLRNIGSFAFYECFNLKTIDNRSKEIKFGENSFYRTSIEKIDFPSNSTFDSSSFKGCMKLKQLTFLNKPEKLIFNEESFAFSGLEELSLDCDVEINENAFIYCLLLKQVTLKGKSVKLHKSSFNFSKIDSCILNTKIDSAPTLEIIDDVFLSSIEKASFVLKYHDTYSSKLKTEKHFMNHKCYVIDHDLVYANLIDNLSLFEKSPPGKKVQIKKNEVLRVPSNVKSLNFPIMSHIRKIQWPSNCIIEELGVFSYYNLTEITIPKLVTVIPPHCFEHCHYLQVVLFEEDSKLKEIGKYGFAHTIIEKIDLPETVKIIDDYSFYNTHKLKEVAFHGEIISQSAFEQSAITTFNLSNNTTVIGYDAFRFCRSLTQFNIDIDNSNLSEINSNAFEESSITSINIPPEITTLYDNTFKGCQFLKEINFSRKSKLSKIERFAFVGNISLSRIIIPEKLKNVFNEAINNDFNLLNDRFFTIEGNELQPGYVNESQIEKCCFISILSEDENGEQLQFNPDCFVENNCYVVSNELKYAHLIDNSLLYIKPTEQTKGKLRENEVLRVPSNVKKLNFPEMTHIKRVLFGPNCIVEDLGSFRYYNLTEIQIPKLVKIIPPHCFEHCHHLKVVQFHKNSKLKEIGEYGFANTKIEQIELPKTVQIIGNYSFFNDHKLKEVIFEGKTIGDFAFAQSGLTKFNLSNKTKTIGNGAFQYCRSLTNFEIDIENSVLSKISQFAFQEAAITEINIPPKVKRINAYAFNGCQFLKEVIISSKSKLSKIKEYSFAGCLSLTNINIPKTITELNSKALINTPSLLMIMNRPNQYFRVMKNYTVYGKDGSLVFVPRELIKYRVMRNTFTINSGAFCGPCLEKVTFSDNSLIRIEDAAFAHSTALRKVHLPNSIRVIGEDAFIDCQSLERLDFEPITKLKEIPRFCFAFSGLKSIRLPISLEIIHHSSFYMCQNLKNVNLADTNVKYIGDCAFSDANLSEVKLPSSVKFIGSNAFHGNKSMKLVDLTKLDIIVDTNQLPIISFIKQIKQSNRKLLNAIDDFVSTEFEKKMKIEAENKQNNKEKEQIEQNVDDEELNGTKDNSNVSQQSNNVPKISLNMISKKNPVIVKPGVSSSRPTSSRNPSQGRSQTNIINNPIPILPPQEENQSKSPRKINRNQSNANDNNTNEVVEETIVFEYNDNNEKEDDNNKNKVCFIHEFAFNNSQIKLFNLELDEYKWFSFFDYCARIEQYAINKNIVISLHKLIKEKPKVGNLTGSFFKIKKFDCQDSEETLPMFLGPLTRRRMRTLNPFHFANFTKLTHVTLDDNVIVSEIPKFCFAYSGLKEITIPSSIKIINKSAFFSCRLGKIIFSKESKLEEIKEFAFYECRKLSSINIPSSVKSIPKKCFALSGLKSIKLPKNTKTIDYMAFANCNKLAKVVLNKGIEKLGDYSFFSNPLLESIDIPDSLKTIKSYSFSCCTNLKQVNTTENTNLVEIYNGAFENTQIEELFINKNATKLFEPTRVPKLNKIAFYKGQPVNFIQLENGTIFEKTNFPNVKYEEVIQKIKDSFHYPQTQYFIDARNYLIHKSESQLNLIFAPKNLETLKICGNCFSIGKGIIDDMVNLTAIEYMEGSTNYVMNFPCYNRLNTGKFNKLKEIKILGNSSLLDERVFSYFNSIEVIEFGEQTNLLYIPKYAFLSCENLRKIRIPSSCYSIDEGAFKDCTKLEEFEIGIKGSNKSLKYIKKDAFYNCSSLMSIEIPSSVTVIFENAFMNCSKLEKVQINELDCNHGLKMIKKNAFKNCASLTSFNLPKSCLYVGPCCFMNCTSLQTFQYEGYYLSSIECKTFYNCTSLTKFEITKLRNEFYGNEEGDDDDEVIKLLYKLDYHKLYEAIDDMKKNEENIFYFINFNRFESFNKFGNKRFCIMKEAFMNCTSLKEVTIEDNSKNSSFNLFDENKKLLFKYQKPGIYIYQFIGKKAFYNCESLTKVRLFLAHLDLFDESSFENCSSLVEIETNTPYWKLMITENMRKDAFAGTNEKLEIKLFDEGKYTEISTKVDNKKQTKHTQIRYFKDHLSSLNKTKYLFDWSNESKQNQSINKREINNYGCLFYSIEKRDYDENEQNKQQLSEVKSEQNKQQLSEVKSEQNKQQSSEVKSEQNKQQLSEAKSEQNKQKLNENNKIEYKIDKIKRKRHFKEYLSHLNKEFLAWIIPEKCDKVEKKNAQKTNFHHHKFELYGTSLIYYNGNPGPGAYNIPSCIGNVPPISFHYQYHRCKPLTYSDVYPST